MARHLHAFSILVPDYDVGLAFYVDTLGFVLRQDVPLPDGKRWVLIAPDALSQTNILLAQAADAR